MYCLLLLLKVYNQPLHEGGKLLQTLKVPVKGESYDIVVDICFPNSDSQVIDFGNVKVANSYTQPFLIKNKGNYDILFK